MAPSPELGLSTRIGGQGAPYVQKDQWESMLRIPMVEQACSAEGRAVEIIRSVAMDMQHWWVSKGMDQ